MSSFIALDLPPIDEGSCLLRSYALQRTRVRDSDVLVFHYPSNYLFQCYDEDEEEVEDNPATMLGLCGAQQLYTLVGDKLRINPDYLYDEPDSTLVMYSSALPLLVAKQWFRTDCYCRDFVGCDSSAAKVCAAPFTTCIIR